MKLLCRILTLSLVLLLPAARVNAHAFLERSDPSVGSKVHSAAAGVRIWFTEAIEPRFTRWSGALCRWIRIGPTAISRFKFSRKAHLKRNGVEYVDNHHARCAHRRVHDSSVLVRI